MLHHTTADPHAPTPPHTRRGIVAAVADWSARHRALAIGGWLALVALAVLSGAIPLGEQARATDPGEAGVAEQRIDAAGGYAVRENVLITGPGTDAAVTDLVTALESISSAASGAAPEAVADIGSPLSEHGERWLADDGAALVTFAILGPDAEYDANYRAVLDAVAAVQADHPDTELLQAGDATLSGAVDAGIKDDMHRAETTSLPLTVLVLLAVFGSIVAAGLPLLLAATSVAGAFGLLALLGHWLPFNGAGSAIVLLIGMAVGIDYSLFYLRRFREERAAGHDPDTALRTTARTSGHVVAASGLTVIVCMAGLLITGIDVLKGLALGTVLVVALAVLGSITVLPALIATLRHRVDAARLPWIGKRRIKAEPSRLWERIAAHVVRRPVLTGGLAAVLLLIAATPVLGLRLQDAAVTASLPPGTSTAADNAVTMQEHFPGSATSARVVITPDDGHPLDTAALETAVERLHAAAAASDGRLLEPITTTSLGDALVIRVPLAGDTTGPEADAALAHLRDHALPAALGHTDTQTAVTGKTALPHDFTQQLTTRTPWVIAFILLLAFALLAVTFRSWALPLASIALNLLSIGAACGALTWVFQGGHFEDLLGFTSYGGVVSWIPIFMFIILFGLSMDYHIFVLSRVAERRRAGAAGRDAIVGGIAASAGVVSSAALIMTGVFSVFVTLSAIEYKMLGLGMALAILLDATVVRGVLLPAALALMGDRAWGRALH
ncbi:MMPL family transporter [Glycomyces algeriensis]|uniref:Exporter n=1 Tax=Glycomyces algeriensis TaxID=256037 RepID=A0A9W6GB12_9ACTN|nr:MMPL family transporter [Glycomyces algeriensis]MDA1364765.1 MMPL family transporter [Glycomyces algeriensis]MDR7350806.1 RND superfamily putative drug exporter [Glycomyces algeriensis]GLI43517.1 exporter [Glycomyces algeriensis]